MAGPIRISVLANATQAKKEIESVTTTGDKLKKGLATAGKVAAAGLLIIGAAAVKAGQAAAADEAAQSRLAQTTRSAANATKAQIDQQERFITAAGKSYGVADDNLRPALAKLVAVTHDVGKAQKLSSLAMDISAARGLSLESVAQALAKAQTGSVAGLAKLGIQTKESTKDTAALQAANIKAHQAQTAYNAALKAFGPRADATKVAASKLEYAQTKVGEAQQKTKTSTIDADEAMQRLASTYRGAAAKAAQTTAGKQKILQVQLGELQEQIGAKLLPIMNKLVDVGLKVVDWASQNTGTVKTLAIVIGSLAAAVLVANAAMKAYTATMVIVKAVTTAVRIAVAAWRVAQFLLNIVLAANPIGAVVIAVGLLVAAIVLAYTNSKTFRDIVQAAGLIARTYFGIAVTAVRGVITVVKNAATWVGTNLVAAYEAVKTKAGAIASVLAAPFVALYNTLVKILEKLEKIKNFAIGKHGPNGVLLENQGNGRLVADPGSYSTLTVEVQPVSDTPLITPVTQPINVNVYPSAFTNPVEAGREAAKALRAYLDVGGAV